MFGERGRGRAGAAGSISSVRDVTPDDVAICEASPVRRTETGLRQFRDSHHMVARLYAMGFTTREVAFRSGYSLNRVSVLYGSPAMQELIAQYRNSLDQSWKESTDEWWENTTASRNMVARLTRDKLEKIEDTDDITFGQLVALGSDLADRTGYPKRTIAVNVNVDFAAQLDRAIERSKQARQIEGGPSAPSIQGPELHSPGAPAPPFRRRA